MASREYWNQQQVERFQLSLLLKPDDLEELFLQPKSSEATESQSTVQESGAPQAYERSGLQLRGQSCCLKKKEWREVSFGDSQA